MSKERLHRVLKREVEYPEYDYDRNMTITKTAERYRPQVKWAAFGLSALAIVGLVYENGLDVFGDHRSKKTPTALHEEAVSKYMATVSEASPADKFSMQFTSVANVVLVAELDDGNGLAGLFSNEREVTIDTNCLNNTAYDINGGEFKHTVSGFRFTSTAEASIPTAAATAYVSSDDPNTLIVRSGNAQGVNLTFTGAQEGILAPANSETQNVLDTYGCTPIGTNVSDKAFLG